MQYNYTILFHFYGFLLAINSKDIKLAEKTAYECLRLKQNEDLVTSDITCILDLGLLYLVYTNLF